MNEKEISKNNAIEFYQVLLTVVILFHHSQCFIGDLSWLKHGYMC